MPYDLFHRSPAQDAVLDAVIDAARAHAHGGVVALDLDGCLFDNRPRQVQIFRAWASSRGDTRLSGLSIEHFQCWDHATTFERLGLAPGEARELAQSSQDFWQEAFFDDPYVIHDLPLPGAARLARQVADTGARVVYLTGRVQRQDPSTLRNLRRFGFPVQEGCLWSNPGGFETDEAWKLEGFRRLTASHELAAFVDNEPAHICNATELYPEALVVWVRTDHSPRPIRVPEGTPSLRGFLRTTDPV